MDTTQEIFDKKSIETFQELNHSNISIDTEDLLDDQNFNIVHELDLYAMDLDTTQEVLYDQNVKIFLDLSAFNTMDAVEKHFKANA